MSTEEEQFAKAAQAELANPPDGAPSDEGGKLKQLLGILKKTVGKDLASIRLSLPSSFLHPQPNLDYWCYLDRPDLFTTIADNDNELERMKAVLRFCFSKDLKFAKGKVCKPYNSVLGEQFRAIWDVEPTNLDSDGVTLQFTQGLDASPDTTSYNPSSSSGPGSSSSASSIRSVPPSPRQPSNNSAATSSQSSIATYRTAGDNEAEDDTPATSLGEGDNVGVVSDEPFQKPHQKSRIVFINEQVSHHPPVSSFWCESCPAESQTHRVQAYGIDEMSAKFTGTSVKVFAGTQNKGIFVRLPDRNNEEYNITHPQAAITGLLRGSPYITISDHTYITCLAPSGNTASGTKALRAIIYYPEESWIGKARFAVEGIVYEYEIGSPAACYTKIKQVPEKSIKGWIEGNWRGQISWRTSAKDRTKAQVLLDLSKLLQLPKSVRPLASQGSFESRKLWSAVTEAIQTKQFGQATKVKQQIEQAQRDLAAERTKAGKKHVPVLFDDDTRLEIGDGRPTLSAEGKKVLQRDMEGRGYSPMEEKVIAES